MDTLILLTIVGAAIFIVNTLSGKLRDMHFRFEEIKAELQIVRAQLESLRRPDKIFPEKTSLVPDVIPEVIPAEKPSLIPGLLSADILIPQPTEKTLSEPTEKVPDSFTEKTVGVAPEKVISEPITAEENIPASKPPVYHEPQPGFFARFMQNNPDLEKFIGENLINKIGIAILVLGIGYFVKFAIDQNWINEIGRVFIGILSGGILIGIAHWLRKKFAAFSSVLVGGGLAVLYFTIAIAFHEYQLFTQAAAFGIMVVITGFSVLLSVSYNRIELAVLAILGGFATPFMVSTGEGNYQVLFTYLLILNVGMLVLAYLKGWKLINWICYGFTVLLFVGWLSSKVLNSENAPYLGALVFATLFFVVFFLMNIINNVKEKIPFVASEIGILLSNTFLYYAAGMTVLSYIQHGLYQGLFTTAVAVFNFIFAFLLFRSQKVDRNLVYLLIGLVITFISLAIPVQLEGNYITMFWALEAVLLLWFSRKSDIRLAFASSVVISGLMLISLIMDWDIVYQHASAENSLTILINKGFITGLICVLSLTAIYQLLKKDPSPVRFAGIELQPIIYRNIIGYVLAALIYLVLLFELNYQLQVFLDSGLNRSIILGCYNLGFVVMLLVFAGIRKVETIRLQVLVVSFIGLLVYAVYYNLSVYKLLVSHLLYNQPEFIGFAFHYLGLFLFLAIIYFIYQNRNLLQRFGERTDTFLLWFLCFLMVYIISSELLYLVLYFNFTEPVTGQVSLEELAYFESLQRQTFKVGFPILWGICAFILMFTGLKIKNKHLRIIALSLFIITLAKLFLFDIRGISEGGKIAAFICLGVLLLVISFMYQNLKKLILTDETLPKGEEEK